MATESALSVNKVSLAKVSIWTPSGEEVWSGDVHTSKAQKDGTAIHSYAQWNAIDHARQQYGDFLPSSGLWYQAREKLQKENPNVEADFITGLVEDTSTVFKILKRGKYADGLVIQYPRPNNEGNDFERDEKGIPKARQIWQMALPLSDSYVRKLSPEFDTFLNTIYGMPDARNQLTKYAFVWMATEENERRALRSNWDWSPREDRRVNVSGHWRPSDRYSDAGFRVFEGGEEAIKDIDARKRKLIVESSSMADAEKYASQLRELGIPFSEE